MKVGLGKYSPMGEDLRSDQRSMATGDCISLYRYVEAYVLGYCAKNNPS